jgi:hypothetical protein
VLIAAGVAALACPPTAPDLLLGHWRGRASDEHWVAAGEALLGVALSDDGFALLRVERGDGGAYVARPGGGDAVRFRCAESGPGVVAWEHPVPEASGALRYARGPRGLSAQIGDDRSRRWRAFAPVPVALPADAGVDPAAAAWWGDDLLAPSRAAGMALALRATARRGDQLAAVGTAALDGAVAPFAAVWRLDGDAATLVGFSAWPARP